MNNNIIKKCLDELQKENFRKDYVIGMLETLSEMSGYSVSLPTPVASYNNPTTNIQKNEEESVPDYLKAGPIGRITN